MPAEDQHWTRYAASLLIFSAATMLLTYLALRLQHVAAAQSAASRRRCRTGSHSRRRASFTTNTNWQSYAGESTMSYFSQMTQLAYHNFMSAAVGMCGAIALARGIANRSAGKARQFLGRSRARHALPVHPALDRDRARARAAGRDPELQRLRHRDDARGREAGDRDGSGREPGGDQAARHERRRLLQRELRAPVRESDAALESLVRWLRSSRSPPRSPTPSAGWCATRATDGRSGPRCSCSSSPASPRRTGAEARGNPIHAARGIDVAASATNPGGNMEGKEVRFGIASSALYATVTTDASCGAVNAMHDSFTPIGGMVPLVNMQLGELIFGGVGLGPLRNAHHGRAHGVHRRTHGRTHARIPRQEDPGGRGADGDALRARIPCAHSRRRRDLP